MNAQKMKKKSHCVKLICNIHQKARVKNIIFIEKKYFDENMFSLQLVYPFKGMYPNIQKH